MTPVQVGDAALVIEVGLRGAFVVMLLVLAALLLREHGRSAPGRLAALLALGCAAYGVQSALLRHGTLQAWQAPLQGLMTGNPVMLWLLAEALFDDRFTLRAWHWAVWAGWAGLGLLNCYVLHSGVLGTLLEAGPLLFSALAVRALASAWRGDLVEGRPALRRRVLAWIVAYTVVTTLLGGNGAGNGAAPVWAGLLDAAVLAMLALAVALPLLALRRAPLLEMAVAMPPAAPATGSGATPAPYRDDAALARLQRAMREQQAWRREGLTIGQLAADLALPEYRLRRTINQQLGYRNFNAFLNGHRIAFARAALADATRCRTPVLEIALEAGFQSLGPFNRAFKAETGMTPTDFRRRAERASADDASNSEIGVSHRTSERPQLEA